MWEDQYVVYNGASGSTHLLDPVTALVVQEVLKTSSEAAELIRTIGDLLRVELTQELHETLLATLQTLDRLGLVEAVHH